MRLSIARDVSAVFQGLGVWLALVNDVSVTAEAERLEPFIAEAVSTVRKSFKLEELTKNPLVRAYRDFFWRMGVDPTKTRPSAEALLRRVLQGKEFPRVNTLVDVYNVVSMKNIVPIAAFDADRLAGDLVMRFARGGESFRGIGMEKPLTLSGGEVVVEDGQKLIAVYPYRDADSSKVTEQSRNVLLMVCGVPGVQTEYLKNCLDQLVEAVLKYCGGRLVWESLATS
ncbi:MAG: phenylalanine--tRNA ligase beta subunit-related protein [Candidatus Caldarchaeum sp.]|uniref:B3/B4 tRNA-binding domain-containing protein n=1 Tax=Caldiarchaeum subterraneum TaxID=311458 RepID=A0A7C5Q772_CALS0